VRTVRAGPHWAGVRPPSKLQHACDHDGHSGHRPALLAVHLRVLTVRGDGVEAGEQPVAAENAGGAAVAKRAAAGGHPGIVPPPMSPGTLPCSLRSSLSIRLATELLQSVFALSRQTRRDRPPLACRAPRSARRRARRPNSPRPPDAALAGGSHPVRAGTVPVRVLRLRLSRRGLKARLLGLG
jgi:hypothetical protein